MIFDWPSILDPSGVPVDENRVRAFEQAVGFTLPDDYREFALKYNGGMITCEHTLKNETTRFEGVLVDLLPFYPKSSTHFSMEAQRFYQELSFYGIRQSVGIGGDGSSGIFFLILAGESRGAIHYSIIDELSAFAPSEEEWKSDEIRIPKHLLKVANSFNELGDLVLRSRE